jgi:MFS family permease
MEKEFRVWSKNFLLIFSANFLYFGSFYLLIPTMPQYVEQLGGTAGQIGLVMGFFTLAAVIVRPSFGRLADQLGRKRLMLIGVGCFALVFLAYMKAYSVALLYCIRILHGLAHAAFLAASAAYIADLAPPQRRGEIIGLYGASNVIAMALFPAIGTAIIQQSGSFIYLLTVSGAAAGMAFCLLTGLGEISSQHLSGAKSPGLLTIGRRREVLIPSLALLAGATVYGATLTFLPVFAPERGIHDFGIFFTVFAAFTLLSRITAGKLSDKVGRYQVIIPFMGLVAAAALMLPSLSDIWMLSGIGACFGFGFGAFMPTLNALVVDRTPPPERGGALGFFTSFMDLGIAAGSVVLGMIGERFGYASMFYLAGMIMGSGLLVFAVYLKPARTD